MWSDSYSQRAPMNHIQVFIVSVLFWLQTAIFHAFSYFVYSYLDALRCFASGRKMIRVSCESGPLMWIVCCGISEPYSFIISQKILNQRVNFHLFTHRGIKGTGWIVYKVSFAWRISIGTMMEIFVCKNVHCGSEHFG